MLRLRISRAGVDGGRSEGVDARDGVGDGGRGGEGVGVDVGGYCRWGDVRWGLGVSGRGGWYMVCMDCMDGAET